MPVIAINASNFQKGILTWLKVEEGWSSQTEKNHATRLGTTHQRVRYHGSAKAIVNIHGSSVTDIVEDCCRKPFESLRTIGFSRSLLNVKCMGRRENVNDEYKVMHDVKDFIWNAVAKEGSYPDKKQTTNYTVT